MNRLGLSSVTVAAVLALSAVAPAWASRAAAHPQVSVKPATVKVGQKATLSGKNFRAGQFYVFLVVVGKFPKPRAERFIGTARPAKNGTINMIVKFPLEPVCGRASIYGYSLSAQKNVIKLASVTLTGCKASGSGGSIPPPRPPGNGQKPPKPPKP